MELLDIGEVRRRTGMTASALRFYEQRGLIASTARHGLRRQYAPDVIDRLALIALLRDSGFTLAEIADVLASAGGPDWKRLVRAKHAELDRRIDRLTQLRDRLERALTCPSPTLLACPHVQRALTDAIPARDG